MTYLILTFAWMIPLWALVLLGLNYAIIGTGKKVYDIGREEIKGKGTLTSFILPIWAINTGAWYASAVPLAFITERMPFFKALNPEIDIAAGWNAHPTPEFYAASMIFIGIWAFFYAMLMLPGCYVFRRKILSAPKRRKLYWTYMVSSVLISVLVLSLFIFL